MVFEWRRGRFAGREGARSCSASSAGANPAGREDGYALIDALTALMIFSMALVFSLQAVARARLSADQATEVAQAHQLLAWLIETGPRSFTDSSGVAQGFTWRIETRSTGAERPIAVCHRQAFVTNLLSHRAYQAETQETCPTEPAS